MGKNLSILYVTPEIYPFIKNGGIADTSFSFTMAVKDSGHDIRVMVPKYGHISERKNKIHEINRLKDMPISVGKVTELATVKSSSLTNTRTKVQAYITTNGRYFDQKKSLYFDPKTGKEFPDNDERFIFFNKSVVETCMLLGWEPDIIHCNDWQAGLIGAYVKQMYPDKFKNTKIVLTIHNFNRQGVYPVSTFAKTGFDKEIKPMFVHKRKFNFMKAAIENADYITTNSPSYAEEILKDTQYSDGLNKVLAEHKDIFEGIGMGIDPYQWNPKFDTDIYKKLEQDFASYKTENKRHLMKEAGLPFNQNTPTIGIITKLSESKGIPLFIEAADKLLKENLQIVMLASGDKEMMKKLKKLEKKYSGKFSIRDEFNERFAHQINAGSDFILMTNKFAPTGLNALYALNAGTVPIVSHTGALKDVVEQFDPSTKTGNGFVIKNYKASELIKTVKSALALFNEIENWNRLIDNALNGNYTWKEIVKKYDAIYRQIKKDN
jgi:starch synthase